MIDLHSHILHGIDDGAPTLGTALAMARVAVADGIRVLAATPHSPESSAGEHYSVALIQQRLDELRAALAAENIGLELVAGTEIHYAPAIVERLQQGLLLPYQGSRTVLLEPPYHYLPPLAELLEVIDSLHTAGYRVLFAHPERLKDVQQNPFVLAPLVERGVLMQITSEALTGGQGEQRRQVAASMLREGLGHLIASDAHGLTQRSQRPPLLRAARDVAADLVGARLADALVVDIPAALLHDAPLPQIA